MLVDLAALAAPAVWRVVLGPWRPKWWNKALGGKRWRPGIEFFAIFLLVRIALEVIPLVTTIVPMLEAAAGKDAIFLCSGVLAVVVLIRVNAGIGVDEVSRVQEGVELAVDRFGERPFFTAKDVVKALEEGTNNLVPRTTPAKVSIPKGKSFGGSVGGAVGDAFGAIGKAGSAFGGAIGGLFSDVRLKSRLTHVGEYKPGVGIYEWEWTKEALELGADPNRTRGVLAQDVQHVDPEAVSRGDDGYLRIAENYFREE